MPSLSPLAGTLGRERAAHLLRRATFGPTAAEIEQFAGLSAQAALDILLTELPLAEPPKDPATGESWLPKRGELNSSDDTLFTVFKAWWLERMRTESTNLRERMTYFLHTHMPVDYELIRNPTAIYYQNELYRRYALGSFRKLFPKASTDNTMLLYIDNTLNDEGSPNENYAREMLELYSIGKGPQIGPSDYTNYTEYDVQQAARVLTGIKHNFEFDTIDPDTLLPRGKIQSNGLKQAYRHDAGVKTFSDKFGSVAVTPKTTLMEGEYVTEDGVWDELEQMMDMIFAQPETARFICRKLYRFFVYYKITPEVEQNIIEPLAETFRSSEYNFATVLRQLFESEYFYDTDTTATKVHVRGAQIKSPMEVLVGMLHSTETQLPSDPLVLYNELYPKLFDELDLMGMNFFRPIDVAGYPPYHQEPAFNRNWISPNYLARRYEFALLLAQGFKNESNETIARIDVVQLATKVSTTPEDARSLVQDLVNWCLPKDLTTERFDFFMNDVLLDQYSASHWTDEWKAFTSSNDDTAIRPRLQSLIVGLLQSPEYQLM